MGGHDTDQLTLESQSLNADSSPNRLVFSSHKCPVCDLFMEEHRLDKDCCRACEIRKKYGFKSFSGYLQQRKEDARLTEEETSGEIVDNGSDLPGKKLWLRHFLMTAGIAVVAAIFMGFQNKGGKKRAGSTQR